MCSVGAPLHRPVSGAVSLDIQFKHSPRAPVPVDGRETGRFIPALLPMPIPAGVAVRVWSNHGPKPYTCAPTLFC
uniref:Uncharacterized protein n=1 Tax=mine drainage metagenome TaxID=410659 RepID=E6PVF3_9ZZZZ